MHMPKKNVSCEIRYAGFWTRAFASLLDTLFVAVPIGAAVYLLSGGEWFDMSQFQNNIQYAMSGNAQMALTNQPPKSLKWELFFEFAVIFATILFWKRFQGATPGKKTMHIKVVDADTFEEIGTKQAVTRSLGYVISTAAFLTGFIMVAFRDDKRALHDLLAGTAVVYDT